MPPCSRLPLLADTPCHPFWICTLLRGDPPPASPNNSLPTPPSPGQLHAPAGQRAWLEFWVVLGAMATLEWPADLLLCWLPLYYELKLALVVALWHPRVRLASLVFDRFLTVSALGASDAVSHQAFTSGCASGCYDVIRCLPLHALQAIMACNQVGGQQRPFCWSPPSVLQPKRSSPTSQPYALQHKFNIRNATPLRTPLPHTAPAARAPAAHRLHPGGGTAARQRHRNGLL